MNLFIIGNGFDIAHGLPTRYNNFRDFLVSSYNIKEDNSLELPYLEYKDNSNITYEDKAKIARIIVKYIDGINGGNWCNFEEYLGKIDYNKYLNILTCTDIDLNNNLEKKFICLCLCFKKWLSVLFEEWINSIKIENIKINNYFKNYINPEKDYFLTFNYTKILENLYKCKNVLHIHGCIDKELHPIKKIETNLDKIIFGYKENAVYLKSLIEGINLVDDMNGIAFETASKLIKRVDKVINMYSNCFEKIERSNITRVNSYGFSFSEVDLTYIKKIISSIKINKWYLNKFSYYNKKELRRIKQILKSFGFKGKVRKFHC